MITVTLSRSEVQSLTVWAKWMLRRWPGHKTSQWLLAKLEEAGGDISVEPV